MFDPTSRYCKMDIKTITVMGADGEPRAIRYIARRFVPQPGVNPQMVKHKVAEQDRIDNVTAKYLGDPTQFWRVADANAVTTRPEELTSEINSVIVIPIPVM